MKSIRLELKNFLLLLAVIVMNNLNCQTITQSFNEPSIGEVDKNYKLDTSAYTGGLPINVTGTNAVWDFTKVTGTFPVIFDSIKPLSTALGGSAFAGASYGQQRTSIISFFKSVSSPSQTELLGVYSPSLTVTFTNSAIVATYPISYGYSNSDTVIGTFKYNTTNGVCNGKITVTADGLGTLNLPNNVTFQNVLRLKSVEQLTMTVGFLPAGTIKQSIYSYYVPGKKYPVISVQYQNYQLLVGTPTITALAYGDFQYFTVPAPGSGLTEFEAGRELSVYPNPFTQGFSLGDNVQYEVKEISIHTPSGSLLQKSASLNDLHPEALPPGIYLLEVNTDAGRSYRKIIKE